MLAEASNTGVVEWRVEPDAVFGSVRVDGTPIEIDRWAVTPVRTEHGQPGRLGQILRLVEDGTIEVENENVILLHSVVASLPDSAANEAGLPRTGDFSVEISSTDVITSENCTLHVRLWSADGLPVPTFSRVGAIFTAGGQEYRCSTKQYQLLKAVEAFNATGADTTERMKAWGKVAPHLPDDVRIDKYLAETRIVYATSFSIQPHVNADNEPDFHIIPGRVESRLSEDGISESTGFVQGLPEARQETFDTQFEQFRNVHPRYPAGDGWHVVLEKDVERVLSAAREAKDAPIEQRRAFIQSPHVFLREALESASDDPGGLDVEDRLDGIFWDEGYSERVAGIGLWQPKVLPWLKTSGEDWLPGEDLGVRIGDRYVKVEAEELDELRTRVSAAIESGEPSVEFSGTELPASEETLSALSQLIGITRPDSRERRQSETSEGPIERHVLLIKGNFDDVEYLRANRSTRASLRSQPSTISEPLPHQSEALEWLREHWEDGSPGALLADDMGLGKTFVALAFLALVRDQMQAKQSSRRPMLTVGPTALLENWVAESEKHLPSGALGNVIIARGRNLKEYKTKKTTESAFGTPTLKYKELAAFDWVLTTYETWRDYQHSFSRIDWGVAVFDEVQKVKNPAAAVTDAAKAIKAEFCLALTGTPVENRLADLWCITDLVQPGRLGSLKNFSANYEQPVGSEGATLEAIEELRAKLKEPPALMQRRLKEDHLDGLPPRTDQSRRVTMPTVQAEAYGAKVQEGRLASGRGHMLKILGDLRSISLHPGRTGDESDEEFIGCSARLQRTFKVLDSVEAKQEKALVFIESREMQGEMCAILQRRYDLPGPPLIINGSVAGSKRQQRVDEFQSRRGFDVMLLSPKAGGVGLTLTAANHVVHLSRWWNPAVEDQCTDRVYRIGQDKQIHVYHPIAVHPQFGDASFDIQLANLLCRKRKLSRAVLAPSAPTTEDLQGLFDDSVTKAGEEPIADDELERIDLMEPTAFERWFINRLGRFGYDVKTTPATHDGGADAVAIAPEGSGLPNLIVQCKHTQREQPLPRGAVDEVVAAADRYQVEEPVRLIVASNASEYSPTARRVASEHDVRLIGRDDLGSLRSFLY